MTRYLVRWESDGFALWSKGDGCVTQDRERAASFTTLETAIDDADDGFSRARILSITDDGSETILPTYGEALAEVDRLNAELAKLSALKSAEIAPVIERFRAAFGADAPQAPSTVRLAFDGSRCIDCSDPPVVGVWCARHYPQP